jgi:hypothetical protein
MQEKRRKYSPEPGCTDELQVIVLEWLLISHVCGVWLFARSRLPVCPWGWSMGLKELAAGAAGWCSGARVARLS